MPHYTNAKTNVPGLFREIMRNQAERDALHVGGITQRGWRRLGELVREMKEYRRGAEKALHWNQDKGNTA